MNSILVFNTITDDGHVRSSVLQVGIKEALLSVWRLALYS